MKNLHNLLACLLTAALLVVAGDAHAIAVEMVRTNTESLHPDAEGISTASSSRQRPSGA